MNSTIKVEFTEARTQPHTALSNIWPRVGRARTERKTRHWNMLGHLSDNLWCWYGTVKCIPTHIQMPCFSFFLSVIHETLSSILMYAHCGCVPGFILHLKKKKKLGLFHETIQLSSTERGVWCHSWNRV